MFSIFLFILNLWETESVVAKVGIISYSDIAYWHFSFVSMSYLDINRTWDHRMCGILVFLLPFVSNDFVCLLQLTFLRFCRERLIYWVSSCGSVGWRVELRATQFFSTVYRTKTYHFLPFYRLLVLHTACADGENKQKSLATVSLKKEDPIGRI